MAEVSIPVVDFSVLGLDNDEIPSDSDPRIQKIASRVCQAFGDIGFVYLKNHGIADDEIMQVRKVSDKFFALPVEEKIKCARDAGGSNHGWVALERESLNPERPADLKEAFNVEIDSTVCMKWPTSTVPDMKLTLEKMYNKCTQLAFRILKVIGIGLKMKSPDWLIKAHKNIGKPLNSTAMRILYYPPIPDDLIVKKDQVRCGEHSDYGSITLLFQDDLGGLQVLPVHGEFIPAPTLPGCVIVNIGDLMQRWTADQLNSTKHRVLIPNDETTRRKPRRSLAFFVHPDDDTVVECLDGSNKYLPITGKGYLEQRFAATYKHG